MGHWQTEQQQEFWIATDELSQTPRHVFYERVNEWLAKAEFASWLEQLCRPHDSQQDRGSIAPGGGWGDFRMLMVGYFEDIDSQHGIVWRCSDSLSLTSFLGHRKAIAPNQTAIGERVNSLRQLLLRQGPTNLGKTVPEHTPQKASID